MRFPLRSLAALATLLLAPLPAAAADRYELAAGDGLTLRLAPDGAFTALQTGPASMLTPGAPSGLWVEDAQTGVAAPLLGHAEIRARGAVLTGAAPQLGLRAVAELVPEAAAIRIKGFIENTGDTERGVDLQIRIYCDAQGAAWFRDTHVAFPITDQPPPAQTIYPFHGLVLPGGRGAFALGVSPERPALFEFGYKDRSYYVLKLKHGLSRHATGGLRQRAHFDVLLYQPDPTWGFRSVTQRYYALHAKWFHRRALRNGLWLFYRPHAEEVPNPWDYAYHAFTGDAVKQDRRQGLATLAYDLPGQREFVRLAVEPKTYADQMKVLHETVQDYRRTLSPASIYAREHLDRRVILTSGVYDAQQQFRAFTRTTEWGGPSLTFVMNPDPDLFHDRPDVTIGKTSLEWARSMLDSIPEMDGLMVDSLFGWGRYFNCRLDHLPYADISLSYDPESRLPAISNQFAHQEYLHALREMLGDKLLMGNGIRPGRFFNGMALDVLSCENPVDRGRENPIMGADLVGGGESEETGLISLAYRNLIFDRIVAYQKPFLIVSHHQNEWEDIATVERFWKIGLFFGVYPGFNWRYQVDPAFYEKHKAIINRYNPLLKQINAAGWEPLTYARSDNPGVWIERYGDAAEGLYITVMNTTDTAQNATISLPPGPLGLSAKTRCLELVQLENLPVEGYRVLCRLQPHEVKLLKISP